MKREDAIDRAIDQAKAFFEIVSSERIASRDKVRVRELIHALEVVSAPNGADFAYSFMPEAYERALEDLIAGRLICHTLEEDAVIPLNEWERYRGGGRSAFDSGFWTGEFSFLMHDAPFADKTPVIDRDEAKAWIQRRRMSGAKVGRPSLEGVKEAYEKAFPKGHAAEGVAWKQAAREVSAILSRSVSVQTLRRRLVEGGDVPKPRA